MHTLPPIMILFFFLDCFLIQPETTCPGVAAPAVSQALWHQSSVKKMFNRLAFTEAAPQEVVPPLPR